MLMITFTVRELNENKGAMIVFDEKNEKEFQENKIINYLMNELIK